MQYARLAAAFDRLEATSKRLEMTAILVEMFQEVPPEEMTATVRLLQGKVAPDWEGVELGLAERLLVAALVRAAGLGSGPDAVAKGTRVYHDAGDLGLAAQRLLSEQAKHKQTGLMAFADPMAGGKEHRAGGDGSPGSGLHVQEVFDRLVQIAHTSGASSQTGKQRLLESLLSHCTPLEAKYVVRTVAGRLRLGVADMTLLDALAAWYLGRGVRSVQEMNQEERLEYEAVRAALEHAYDVRSDLALVAATLATGGLEAVRTLDVAHGTPLRPMAAERMKTLGEILEKHGGRSALEYKYDGLRVQAHVSSDPDVPVRLFSRRMEDLTDQFPDVQGMLRAAFQGTDCIVEGEVVAVDGRGAMLPFQELSRRRGRKTGLGESTRKEQHLAAGGISDATIMEEVPVAVYLFDCLAEDGHALLDAPYEDRRARLAALFSGHDRVRMSAMEVCTDEASMEAFFARAVADGAEGIMCKALKAPYKAGNRGYDWIKFKTDYTEELVDSMDLVAVGAFVGRGRRTGWYGALLMAAHDPDTGTWPSVCKLGTGFDDATLMGLKDRFADHVSPTRPPEVRSGLEPDVWFRPAVVMEVEAAELTLSPTHKAAWGVLAADAGLAARFPRFTGRWRDDKGPEDATTVEELVRMYRAQGKVTARRPR